MDAHLTFRATGLVMAGGAVGAALRFHVGLLSLGWTRDALPLGTLAVNVLGGLAMGALAACVLRGQLDEAWRLFLAVGLLGGFTTFSAFSLELFQMMGRGDWVLAFGYALASVILSTAALAAGFVTMQALA